MLGLVLEGGGAKGSYQIGACKALQELGIEVNGVAGTSIGAINGAMIVQGNLEGAYRIWQEISPAKVFDVKEEYLEALKSFDLSQENLQYFFDKARDILNNRGMDTSLMRKILEENIDEKKLRKSKMDFGIVTVSLTDRKPLEIFLEDIPRGEVINYIMASAGLPVFKLEKIEGKTYIDGGFYNNLPIGMLYTRGYKEFIAVRTHGMGIIQKLNAVDIDVKYIEPAEDVGSILDFKGDSVRKNLQLGYYDALRIFRKLKGREYYIEPVPDKDYFLSFLADLDEESVLEAGKILGQKGLPSRRMLFETVIPRLAELLDIPKESTYEDIVVIFLEQLAKKHDLERFKIYSFPQFFSAVVRAHVDSEENELLHQKRFIPSFIKYSPIMPKSVRDNLIDQVLQALFSQNLTKGGVRI